MIISNSSLNYEVPSTFHYPINTQTINQKIYSIGKKILTFFHNNRFVLGVALSSFLISKTIADTLENIPLESTTMDNLKDCQDRICEYWNATMQIQENLPATKNLLSNINFRCDTSHPHYAPYKSLTRCIQNWCKYANINGENSTECFDPTKKIVQLWNRFCPKSEFMRLRVSDEMDFLSQCLKKLCNYYKTNNEKANYYSMCVPLELQGSMEKLYQLLKDWKNEQTKTKSEGANSESIISIASSSIGIISAGVSIVASVIGCYVAKITMSSVSSALPNVSAGLRHIVDGTLAYARRASVFPTDLLSVASGHARVSEISSQVASVYTDAASSIFGETDIRDFNFNAAYQPDENEILESNVVREPLEAKEVPDEEMVPENDNFFPPKVIQAVETITEKVSDNLSPLNEAIIQGEVISTTLTTGDKFIELRQKPVEFIFPKMTSFLQNATQKAIEMVQLATQQAMVNLTSINETTNYEEFLNVTAIATDEFVELRQRPVEFIFPNNTSFFEEKITAITAQNEILATSSKPLWKVILEYYNRAP